MRPIVLAAFVLPLYICKTQAESPLEAVLKAVHVEEAAPAKRVHLTFKLAGKANEYLVERVLPDRLHLTFTTAASSEELYVVNRFTYSHDARGWHKTLLGTRLPAGIPSITGLLQSRFINVSEVSQPGGVTRVFAGLVSWPQQAGVARGRLDIEVTMATGLPLRARFEGSCGSLACSFDQKWDYDSSLDIEPPR
jgi:hypothetical protein